MTNSKKAIALMLTVTLLVGLGIGVGGYFLVSRLTNQKPEVIEQEEEEEKDETRVVEISNRFSEIKFVRCNLEMLEVNGEGECHLSYKDGQETKEFVIRDCKTASNGSPQGTNCNFEIFELGNLVGQTQYLIVRTPYFMGGHDFGVYSIDLITQQITKTTERDFRFTIDEDVDLIDESCLSKNYKDIYDCLRDPYKLKGQMTSDESRVLDFFKAIKEYGGEWDEYILEAKPKYVLNNDCDGRIMGMLDRGKKYGDIVSCKLMENDTTAKDLAIIEQTILPEDHIFDCLWLTTRLGKETENGVYIIRESETCEPGNELYLTILFYKENTQSIEEIGEFMSSVYNSDDENLKYSDALQKYSK
jgi:hypothetical protein